MDEAETANILISLGNSRSGTPATFTPISAQQSSVSHSPRSHSHSQTPSPAHFGHRSTTFTPISQYPSSTHHQQAGGSAVGTPNKWGSATPLSGRSSAEISSPAVQFQHQQGSHNFATPVSPNKLKLKMEHASRNNHRDVSVVSRSDSNDSGVESVNRSPTPSQPGITPSPGGNHHVMSPPNIMSPPAARQQVTQYFQSPEKSHFEFPPPAPSDNKLRAALLAPRSQSQFQTAQETQTSPIIDQSAKPSSQHIVYADKIPRTNLTKEFEKDQAKLLLEGTVRGPDTTILPQFTSTPPMQQQQQQQQQQHQQQQQAGNSAEPKQVVTAGTQQEVKAQDVGNRQQQQQTTTTTPFQAEGSHPTPSALLPVMPAGGGDKEENNREQRPASKLLLLLLGQEQLLVCHGP